MNTNTNALVMNQYNNYLKQYDNYFNIYGNYLNIYDNYLNIYDNYLKQYNNYYYHKYSNNTNESFSQTEQNDKNVTPRKSKASEKDDDITCPNAPKRRCFYNCINENHQFSSMSPQKKLVAEIVPEVEIVSIDKLISTPKKNHKNINDFRCPNAPKKQLKRKVCMNDDEMRVYFDIE
jgi:hypothetical protein